MRTELSVTQPDEVASDYLFTATKHGRISHSDSLAKTVPLQETFQIHL